MAVMHSAFTSRIIAPSLGSLALLALASLVPAPAAAQGGWAQSQPPDVVLHFQPRTPEEALRAPRMARPLRTGAASASRTSQPLAANAMGVGSWQEWAVPELAGHALVRDSRRGVFYVVGGVEALDPQGIVWAWDPVAGTCAQISTRPGGGGVTFSGAAYDSLRDRLLVLSFAGGAFSLDALSIAGGGWTHLWTGPAMAQPWLMGIAIDTNRDQLALVGVWDPAASRHRLIRIPLGDPAAWTSATIAGSPMPSAVTTGSAVYEPARDRFDVICDETEYDIWPPMVALDSDVWTVSAGGAPAWAPFTGLPFSPTGTTPRQLAYDAELDRLLVVDDAAEAWAVPLAGGSPVRLDDGTAHPLRFGLAAAFDPAGRRVYVHGGQAFPPVLPLFMSLSVDSSVSPWRAEAPAGLGSRWYAAALADPSTGRIIEFDGLSSYDPPPYNSLVVAHDPSPSAGWEPLGLASPVQPGNTWGGAPCYDPMHHALLLYGGQALDGSGDLLTSLWSLSLGPGGAWTKITPTGTSPPALRFAALFCDAPRQRFILLGGDNSSSFNYQAWELRLDPVPAWRSLPIVGDASFRYPEVFADPVRGDAWAYTYYYNSIYHLELDPDTLRSSLVQVSGSAPIPEIQVTAACFDPVRRRLDAFMSAYDDVDLSSLWTATLGSTVTWQQVPIDGIPPMDRGFFPVAYDPNGDRMFLVGGYDDNANYCGDLWSVPFFSDAPTPALVSLLSAVADAAGAHLRWDVGTAYSSAAVERSPDGTAWTNLGDARAQGGGVLSFDDPTALGTARVAYRLRLVTSRGTTVTDAAWVSTPSASTPALSLVALPRGSGGALAVRFVAPAGADARLRLLDVSGRQLSLEHVPSGAHDWTLPARPAPGLYFAELTQGGQRRIARLVQVE